MASRNVFRNRIGVNRSYDKKCDLTFCMICIICITEVRKMATLSVRLPDAVFRRLNKLAEKTRRTKTSFIREMVEQALDEYEEAYVALDRLNDKNAKYLKTEELEEELGL